MQAVRPHGLRRQSITRILELTNGDIHAAQMFARHITPKTTMGYDVKRQGIAGQMSRLVAED